MITPANDILCELAHELTIRECSQRQIPVDTVCDDETIYSPDAQPIFDSLYDIVSRVLEPVGEVQPTITLNRKQVENILRVQMGWEPIDVTSFWRLARKEGAS
jgi:hypothetical protein